jgi:ribosomal protein S18 acetylase RimI-like enzyme
MLQRDKKSLMVLLRATPEFKPAELVVAEEVIDSYLADPKGSGYSILVSQEGLEVNGYICYGPTPLTEGTWDIYWLVVAVGEQGKGLGGKLLAHAEAKIQEAWGRLIVIDTSSLAGYEKTSRFYRKHGYQPIARLSDFYARGDDKIILQKRLR